MTTREKIWVGVIAVAVYLASLASAAWLIKITDQGRHHEHPQPVVEVEGRAWRA